MTHTQSIHLPDGAADRSSFRRYGRIYRKLPHRGRVYAYNATERARFCPFLGHFGIQLPPGKVVLTRLRNPISYTKRIRLHNQMLAAEGIVLGTYAEVQMSNVTVNTPENADTVSVTVPENAEILRITPTLGPEGAVTVTCGDTEVNDGSGVAYCAVEPGGVYTFVFSSVAGAPSIAFDTSLTLNGAEPTCSLLPAETPPA